MTKSRNTMQKEVILRRLGETDVFFTADELYMKVKKESRCMGIATVYRFLAGLRKQGRIYSYKCGRKTVYSTKNTSHCHFICESTGKITHFSIDSVDFLKDKIPGSIKSFQLEVRGVCSDACKKCSGKKQI